MKKQNGITLISLIITIIIMLILAGVSLSMVMGDGSILDQANAAADNTKAAEVQEFVDLAIAGNKAAKYSKIGYQTKEAVADAMVAEGYITAEQKTAMMSNQEVKVAGQVIDYSGLNETVTTYTVKYYDGATLLHTETIVSGGDGTYTAPTKSGYIFSGWKTTNGGSTAATLRNITSDKMVYASYIVETDEEIISFSIDGTTYYVEDGMCWDEWLESDDNTKGYKYNDLSGNSTGGIVTGMNFYLATSDDKWIVDSETGEKVYVPMNMIEDGLVLVTEN